MKHKLELLKKPLLEYPKDTINRHDLHSMITQTCGVIGQNALLSYRNGLVAFGFITELSWSTFKINKEKLK